MGIEKDKSADNLLREVRRKNKSADDVYEDIRRRDELRLKREANEKQKNNYRNSSGNSNMAVRDGLSYINNFIIFKIFGGKSENFFVRLLQEAVALGITLLIFVLIIVLVYVFIHYFA